MRSLKEAEVQVAARTFESRGLNGQEELVAELKDDASSFLARINQIEVAPDNREAARLVALAKTTLEESVMWAVKAISRNKPC